MIRAVALLLTFLTGFSGLVYEVTWQQYLAVLLGSHSEATAAVLGIFLGGLSVGYALFGRVTQRIVARTSGRAPRLLVLYGVVEGGIGLYALLFPTLFAAAGAFSFRVPHGTAGVGFAFDVLLAALLIGPPTILMGGTIPLLTQALAHDLRDATRVHAWVYAFNTAGAFAGALAAGFVLVRWLGLDGVLYAMGCVNLAAGVLFALMQRPAARAVPAAEATPSAALAGRAFAGYAAVALLGGFAMMTVQTVLNRIGGLSFGTSHFTFAMVVAVFVLCIALGSFAVSALPRIPPGLIVGSQWALVALLTLLYLQLDDAPYWAHALRALFRDEAAGFTPYYLAAFLALLAVLMLPVGLSGALLPLLFHHLRDRMGGLGGVAGRLYSWNTVGSLLGALLGGYALLFWLDLHHVYRVALGALVVGTVLLSGLVLRVSLPALALLVAVPVLWGITLLPAWSPERLSAGLFRHRQPMEHSFGGPEAFFAQPDPTRILFYDDDPTTSVAVKEVPYGNTTTRAIVTDGKPDGALVVDYVTMSLAAILPALLADDAEQGFVIGYGTGVTAGELASLEGVRAVEVAEISQGVIDAAPLFEHGNLGAAGNPKVTLLRTDAYRALLRSSGRYGVISSEPSNPWRVGVEMLYSREFLEAARDRLTPGGVYAQWLHLYEIDEESVRIVLRTYASVFEHVSVWYTIGPDILLLGFQRADHALDLERIRERALRPDFARALERLGIRDLSALLAHELLPLGAVNALAWPGEVHTLRRPILSDQAARAFFRGQPVDLPKLVAPASARVAARNSLLARHAGVGAPLALPEDVLEPAVAETCARGRALECAALLAGWSATHPGSERFEHARLAAMRHAPVAPHLQPAVLAPLASLFGAEGVWPHGGGSDPLGVAIQATRMFARYYHHAFPFHRDVLEGYWRRCVSMPGMRDRCVLGRRQAEALVGGLDGSRGSDARD